MIAGLLVMVIGYLCLVGGGSEDPNMFNDAIFSTRRMVVAPILIIAGLVIEVFAIMIKDGKREEEQYYKNIKIIIQIWSGLKR